MLHEHGHAHDKRQNEIGVFGREVCDPQRKRRLAHLNTFEQHPIERKKERHLDQDWQAAGERIYLLALIEFHHGRAERLLIVLIALLHRFHPWLQAAHFGHGSAARFRQLVERELDQERYQNDRNAPVANKSEDDAEQPEQRLRDNREPAVIDGELECLVNLFELLLQLRANEDDRRKCPA